MLLADQAWLRDDEHAAGGGRVAVSESAAMLAMPSNLPRSTCTCWKQAGLATAAVPKGDLLLH